MAERKRRSATSAAGSMPTVRQVRSSVGAANARGSRSAQREAEPSLRIVEHVDYNVEGAWPALQALQRRITDLEQQLMAANGSDTQRTLLRQAANVLSDAQSLQERHYREQVRVGSLAANDLALHLDIVGPPVREPAGL